MNVSTSFEDYPSFDERADNPQLQSCLNNPQPPLLLGVSPQCLLLLQAVAWGAAILAVVLTGYLLIVPGPRA